SRERSRRLLQIRCRLLENRRNVVDPRQDFATSSFVIRRGNRQGFDQRGQRLANVKRRIATPAWIVIELPANSRQSRPNQSVIDLLDDWPRPRVDFFPTRLEVGEVLSAFIDARARPIPHSAGPLYPRDVVAIKRGVFGAPGPKIVSEFIEW